MTSGHGQQRRDFFLQAGFADGLTDDQLLEGFARVSDVVRRYGPDVARANALALCTSERYRRDFFVVLRNAAWVLRQGRYSGSPDRVQEAKVSFAEAVQLLAYAGFSMGHLRQLVGCLTHACTCDGCDLADGARFEKLAAQVETPATVGAVRGRGRVDVTNEPLGGASVDSAEQV